MGVIDPRVEYCHHNAGPVVAQVVMDRCRADIWDRLGERHLVVDHALDRSHLGFRSDRAERCGAYVGEDRVEAALGRSEDHRGGIGP